jgi:CelD/BcsL family acetyltransferase involved in cellulose biosynthesis
MGFHRRLIERALASGRVYFYQSGLEYAEDNRLNPGLVSHYHAVQYCLAQGYQEYDFLGGYLRYKRSLATHDGTSNGL